MKKFILLSVSLLVALTACSRPSAEEREVIGRVKEMISFLEVAGPADFVRAFYDPNVVDDLTRQPAFNTTFVENESESKFLLLTSLRQALDVGPVFSFEGQVASFEDEEMIIPLHLVKRDGNWYYYNPPGNR